jgi:hypothetical protein
LKRRDRWPDLGEVHGHFAAKPMFARWHPAVLDDYVRHGTEPDPADQSGISRRLKFRPEIEAEIYSTVPHRLVPYMRLHPPGAPVAFIAGTRSREVRQAGLAATQRITRGRISWIEGSHCSPSSSRVRPWTPCSTGSRGSIGPLRIDAAVTNSLP